MVKGAASHWRILGGSYGKGANDYANAAAVLLAPWKAVRHLA